MNLYKEHLEKAITAAKLAGNLLVKLFPENKGHDIEERSVLMDFADKQVHDKIYDVLNKDFSEYKYISVFTENQVYYNDRPLWVIDPIVGLGNFSHGDPHLAISIALMINGVTVAAVVYNPLFDELFTATKGEGAYLNGEKLQVSKTEKIENALLSTRFAYDIRESRVTSLPIFNEMILKAESVLNNATATLDMAYVAAGRYEGFWALRMNPWDLVAAILLIKEAGGKVTTLSGENYQIESQEILATNGNIHSEFIESISDISYV